MGEDRAGREGGRGKRRSGGEKRQDKRNKWEVNVRRKKRCEAVKMVHFTASYFTLIKFTCSKNQCTPRLVHATVLKKSIMFEFPAGI
jgi:hypothetical protein